MARFRVAATSKRWDRAAGRWIDGDTAYWSVTAWRRAAENAAGSLAKGHPVVVHGRVRQRVADRTVPGSPGLTVPVTYTDIEALSFGLDLTRCRAEYRRAPIGPQTSEVSDPVDSAGDGGFGSVGTSGAGAHGSVGTEGSGGIGSIGSSGGGGFGSVGSSESKGTAFAGAAGLAGYGSPVLPGDGSGQPGLAPHFASGQDGAGGLPEDATRGIPHREPPPWEAA